MHAHVDSLCIKGSLFTLIFPLWKNLKFLRIIFKVFHSFIKPVFFHILKDFPGFTQIHSPYGGYDENYLYSFFILSIFNERKLSTTMKLTFQKDVLLNGINIVLKAVSSKTTMSILGCILIDASGSEIKLTGNDMELGIETKIEGNILERGKIALDAKIFSEIIRKLSSPDAEIHIETDDALNTVISSENSVFKIQGRDSEEFSYLPYIEREHSITLSQFTLREIIRQTLFSISPNDSNKMMTGELFEVHGNELKVVSLDGHRISIRKIILKENYDDVKVIVPGKTLSEISKILNGDNESEVELFFSQNHILFAFDQTIVVSRLIEGEYFRINQMLSGDYETKFTVNKKDFLDCIERATILIRENDKKPLILNILDHSMELKLNSSFGSMNAELPIHKTGKDIMIGFNPKFLIDALRVIDDEEIDLHMMNPKSPCFIRDEDQNYIYLILPVNFNAASV